MPSVADLVCLTGLCGCVWLCDLCLCHVFPDAYVMFGRAGGLRQYEVPTSTLHYSGSAKVCSRGFFFFWLFFFFFSFRLGLLQRYTGNTR